MAMASPGDETPGTYPRQLGRYELLVPIGTGGMATVFLARAAVVEGAYREVALKIMHPHMAADGGSALAAIVDEAKLAAQIRHPNVVPVLSIEREQDVVALVMEYVEGETLAGLIRAERASGRTMPLSIAARILFDALTGLHAAHELRDERGAHVGLVHRDFSPQNILVGVDGVARLTDFGVAKAASRANATQTGVVKGKIGYMAPEQALGKPIDRRCDVWAAGVVAWELLCGKRLFQGDQVAVMLRIVQEVPARVRDDRPDVPAAIDEIIASALSPDVDERIGSAEELRRRLMDAWRDASSVADTSEVARFVQEIARDRLAARRERVARVLRARAAGLSAPAVLGALPEAGEIEADRGVHELPRLPSRTRKSPAWISAIAVLALATTAGAGYVASSGEATRADEARSAGLLLRARWTGDPERSEVREESLVVRSDRPFGEVRIGRRSVPVTPPAREVTLSLEPGELGRELDLVVVAGDRATVATRVSASTGYVEVSFTKAHAPRAGAHAVTPPPLPKPAPKAASEGATKPQPGLAPTPY